MTTTNTTTTAAWIAEEIEDIKFGQQQMAERVNGEHSFHKGPDAFAARQVVRADEEKSQLIALKVRFEEIDDATQDPSYALFLKMANLVDDMGRINGSDEFSIARRRVLLNVSAQLQREMADHRRTAISDLRGK